MTYTLEIILIIVALLLLFYKFSTRNYDYWKRRHVFFIKPFPFFGNIAQVFLFRTTIGHLLEKFYRDVKRPFYGIFFLNQPCLVVQDPELIKTILVKVFHHFPDHTLVSDERCDPMASNFPFFSKSPQWRFIRTKITPVFTSGKLRNMLPLVQKVADDMMILLKNGGLVEIKEVCAKYATDAIASCAFGIDAHCLLDEDAEFRTMGKSMRDFQLLTTFRHTCYFFAPSWVRFFRMRFFNEQVLDFMRNTFWETLRTRRKTLKKRNDVIDIINQIMDNYSPEDEFKFEGDRAVAIAGQFYSAGFETISSTMAYTLYELCFHPEIREKVRREVKTVSSQYGGLTYEAIQELKYLNMVVSESLRKYPFLPFLDRICTQDFTFQGYNLTVEKGTPVYIPVIGLQHDPDIFPNPDKFDPDRFSEDNKTNFHPFAYLPFGEGPRACIGKRFGLVAVKLGLAKILMEHEVRASEQTPVPLQFKTKGLFLVSSNDIPMRFEKINN